MSIQKCITAVRCIAHPAEHSMVADDLTQWADDAQAELDRLQAKAALVPRLVGALRGFFQTEFIELGDIRDVIYDDETSRECIWCGHEYFPDDSGNCEDRYCDMRYLREVWEEAEKAILAEARRLEDTE